MLERLGSMTISTSISAKFQTEFSIDLRNYRQSIVKHFARNNGMLKSHIHHFFFDQSAIINCCIC